MIGAGAEHQRDRDAAQPVGREAVEEELEETGVGALVRRGREHHEVGGTDLLHQPGHGRVAPVEQRGAEVGQVDHEIRLSAGELVGDVDRGGEGARPRLRVADDDGDAGGHDAALRDWQRTAPARSPRSGAGAPRARASPGRAAPPRRTSRRPRGAGRRRGRTRRCRRKPVLLDPADLLVAAHERGAGPAAHQADAGPDVGVDLEGRSAATVEVEHRVALTSGCRYPLDLGDDLVDAGDQAPPAMSRRRRRATAAMRIPHASAPARRTTHRTRSRTASVAAGPGQVDVAVGLQPGCRRPGSRQ